MQFTFDLPHAFYPGASQLDNAYALRILLDSLVALNRAYLRSNHATPDLYRSGVVYGRTKVWDSIPALYSRGYGDCKSLSAALVAQYLEKGKHASPVFRWIRNAAGGTDYHILVRTADGYEDPSKVLGMTQNENAYFRGPTPRY